MTGSAFNHGPDDQHFLTPVSEGGYLRSLGGMQGGVLTG